MRGFRAGSAAIVWRSGSHSQHSEQTGGHQPGAAVHTAASFGGKLTNRGIHKGHACLPAANRLERLGMTRSSSAHTGSSPKLDEETERFACCGLGLQRPRLLALCRSPHRAASCR